MKDERDPDSALIAAGTSGLVLVKGRGSGNNDPLCQSRRHMTRAMRSLLVFLTAALVLACRPALAADPPRRLKACVVWLNEPHELEAFRTYLDPRQFELVDIWAAAHAHEC